MNRYRTWFLSASRSLIVFALLGIVEAHASPKDCALYIEDRDWDAARPACRQAAIAGVTGAKAWLAWMHYEGAGGPKDAKSGTRWLYSAARDGAKTSQLLLGKRYLAGDGVKENTKEAVKWLRKSAEAGVTEAQFLLGRLFAEGNLEHIDAKEAVKWLKEASRGGSVEADYLLANLYFSGETTDLDDKGSIVTRLNNAARNENVAAQYLLGNLYKHGKIDGDENIKNAAFWWMKAAENGHVKAGYEIGLLHLSDFFGEKDYEKAYQYLLPSADSGVAIAQYEIASLHLRNRIKKSNQAAGISWLQKASRNGSSSAQMALALRHDEGLGVAQSDATSFSWMLKAAEGGSDLAAYLVAGQYYRGYGTKINYSEAARWYEVAADAEIHDAKFPLGRMYLDGRGVQQNEAKAYTLIADAANNLDQEAIGWVEAAANSGDGEYQYLFALLIGRNIVHREDSSVKYSWLDRAARNGSLRAKKFLKDLADSDDMPANFIFGRLQYSAAESKQDLLKALMRIKEAALAGDAAAFRWLEENRSDEYGAAHFFLGKIYLDSEPSQKDISKAINAFEESARAGNSDAFVELGVIYQQGLIRPRDINKARDLYESAANLGNTEGHYNLGKLILVGDGVDRDLRQAQYHLMEAASGKYKDAQALVEKVAIQIAIEGLSVRGFELGEREAKCDAKWITYTNAVGAPEIRTRECRIRRPDESLFVEKMPDTGEVVSVKRYQFLPASGPEPEAVLKAAIKHYGEPSFSDYENWAAMYGNPFSISSRGDSLRIKPKNDGVGLLIKGHLCGTIKLPISTECPPGVSKVLVYELIDRKLVAEARVQGRDLLEREQVEKLDQLQF